MGCVYSLSPISGHPSHYGMKPKVTLHPQAGPTLPSNEIQVGVSSPQPARKSLPAPAPHFRPQAIPSVHCMEATGIRSGYCQRQHKICRASRPTPHLQRCMATTIRNIFQTSLCPTFNLVECVQNDRSKPRVTWLRLPGNTGQALSQLGDATGV